MAKSTETNRRAVNNFDRSGWAQKALDGFCKTTSGCKWEAMPSGDKSDAISDLIADLMHLANQNSIDPEAVTAQARNNYEAELLEVGHEE